MRNIIWIFLFLISCAPQPIKKEFKSDNYYDLVTKEIYPCNFCFTDSLAFRSSSYLVGRDQKIIKDISLDKSILNLSSEISLFLDTMIFQYLGGDNLYLTEKSRIVSDQVSNYVISCEKLDRDTSDMYLYNICIEVNHVDLLLIIEERFSEIDSTYNHLEFTKLYKSKF